MERTHSDSVDYCKGLFALRHVKGKKPRQDKQVCGVTFCSVCWKVSLLFLTAFLFIEGPKWENQVFFQSLISVQKDEMSQKPPLLTSNSNPTVTECKASQCYVVEPVVVCASRC